MEWEDLGRRVLTKRPRVCLLVLSLLCLLPAAAAAHDLLPAFQHLTTDHGLPSSEGYDIIQDRSGYIWVSTDNGVARYDGISFQTFGPAEGLTDKTILFMHEDHRGWIWMCSFEGRLFIYDGQLIRPYAHNNLILQYSQKYYSSLDFFVDTDGTVFLSLKDLGIIKITAEGQGQLYDYADLQASVGILIHGEFELNFRARGELDDPRANTTFGLVTESGTRSLPLPGPQARSIVLDWNTIWSFTWGDDLFLQFKDQGLFHWEKTTGSWRRISDYPFHLVTLEHCHNGGLWLGHYDSGGIRYYASKADFLAGRFAYRLFEGYTIAHVKEDALGAIWIATAEQGVFYLPRPEVSAFFGGAESGNFFPKMVSLQSPDQGYIGISTGELYPFAQGHLLPVIPVDKASIKLLGMWASPTHDALFLGGTGLRVFTNGQWSTVRKEEDAHQSAYVSGGLFADNPFEDDAFWTSTSYQIVLVKFSAEAGWEFVRSLVPEQGNKVFSILHKAPDLVVVGTTEGLFNCVLSTGKCHPFQGDSTLLRDRINALAQLSNGQLLVGTLRNGLLLWEHNSLRQLVESDYAISSVYVDPDDRIWVGTKQGLFVLDHALEPEITRQRRISIADGLPSNEILHLTGMADRIWITTRRGVVSLPTDFTGLDFPDAPLLREARVDNELVSVSQLSTLTHRNSSLQLVVQYLDYRLRGQIRYRYRLSPSASWEPLEGNTLVFSRPAPNDYRIEIQAARANGGWSPSLVVPLTIAPPFWQQLWFFGLMALVLVLLMLSVVRWRTHWLLRQQRRTSLELEVNTLKQQAYRAQMNPHFVFNCLNAIQGFILGNQDDQEKAIFYLSRFSMLMRQALEASQVSTISLAEDIDLLRHYLDLERMRFNEQFAYTITIEPDVPLDRLLIPPMLIQPYVENAVLHGLADRTRPGHIRLHYYRTDHQLGITISDDGIGISRGKQQRTQRQSVGGEPRRRSVGLLLTQKRLELLNRAGTESVRIHEPTDEEGNVLGTEVRVIVPLSWVHPGHAAGGARPAPPSH
ncbi:MAG: histidine kinase [Lewinella sp.]|nr:histidine kinase [Lewinella sp.]